MKRVAIIGCGHIAGLNENDSYREKPCTHAGSYQKRSDVDLVICCDKNLESAQAFSKQFGFSRCTHSIDDVLGAKPDVISVCVPYRFHKDVISEILSADWKPEKILLEKPISDNYADSQLIHELCRSEGVQLYINNRRLSPFYQKLKDLLCEEFNNDIISVSAWCSSGIHAIGTHMIDLLVFVLGSAHSVFAQKEMADVQTLPYSHNFHTGDPRYNAMIGFDEHRWAHLINTASIDFTYFEVEFLCRTGRVRARDNGGYLSVQKKRMPGSSTLSYKLEDETKVAISSLPLFQQVINSVLDDDYHQSDLESAHALHAYEIIDAMRSSALNHQLVNL